jgi:hypothetical protein
MARLVGLKKRLQNQEHTFRGHSIAKNDTLSMAADKMMSLRDGEIAPSTMKAVMGDFRHEK